MTTKRWYAKLEDVPLEIREAYDKERWVCPAPPVSTVKWTILSWINFILAEGRFSVPDEFQPPSKNGA